jgi:uncharacterized membrane protein YhhN
MPGGAAPAVACALAVAALLLAEWRGARLGVWIAKPLAAACFLWAGIAWGALDGAGGRWIFAGLMLCAAGDVLLIPRERAAAFQAGIAAFLLGHVAYGVAFLLHGTAPVALALAAAGMALFAWRTLHWLRPHVPPDFRTPVLAYVGVISAMVALAVGAVAAGLPLRAGVGAVAFAASDLAVARDRFVVHRFANPAWGLPLYFGAQLLLASSAAAW